MLSVVDSRVHGWGRGKAKGEERVLRKERRGREGRYMRKPSSKYKCAKVG